MILFYVISLFIEVISRSYRRKTVVKLEKFPYSLRKLSRLFREKKVESCQYSTNQVDYSNKNHSNVDEIHVRNVDEDETKSVYNDL